MVDDEFDEGVPYFLDRLNLGEDADARAIRTVHPRRKENVNMDERDLCRVGLGDGPDHR